MRVIYKIPNNKKIKIAKKKLLVILRQWTIKYKIFKNLLIKSPIAIIF
jgi:hypothetical protein